MADDKPMEPEAPPQPPAEATKLDFPWLKPREPEPPIPSNLKEPDGVGRAGMRQQEAPPEPNAAGKPETPQEAPPEPHQGPIGVEEVYGHVDALHGKVDAIMELLNNRLGRF